jgi:hypothetical protein
LDSLAILLLRPIANPLGVAPGSGDASLKLLQVSYN